MALAVRLGVSPLSWMNDDLPSLGAETPVETALAEGRRIGYQGFELGGRFPRDPAALRATLAAHELACVSGWWSGRLAGRSVEEELREVEGHLRLLVENGAAVMVYGEVLDSIQGNADVPLYKRPRFRDEAAWRAYGERLTRFARALLPRGLRLAYHHHMGAYVETPADVDRLMSLVGEEVGLLFDSGHMSFAGGDPVAMLAKHAKRVCHVHCKDVRPEVMRLARNRDWSFLDAVINGAFTVPGDGAVDFAALIAILREHHYRGWLVVEAEQDPVVAPSYVYAEKGYRHLRALLDGVRETGARKAG